MNAQTLDPRVQMADLFMGLRWVELTKQLTAWSLLIRRRPWIQLFFQTLLQFTPVSMRAKWSPQGKVEPWVNYQFARKHKMSARQMEFVKGLWFARPSVRDAMQNVMSLSRRAASAGPSVIEKRYPYLDQNLVDFLTSIPLDQLLRPGQRRFLMRRALADLLPSEVLNRKIKARFGRCFCVALEKHWEKVASVLSCPLSSSLGYVERDRFREALVALKDGCLSTQTLKLLDAVSLEFWLRDAVARGVISIHLGCRWRLA